jgi:transposase
LLVDKSGLPVNVRVTPANCAEQNQVVPMLKQLSQRCQDLRRCLLEADKGYDSEPLRYKLGWQFGMGSAIPYRDYGEKKPDPSVKTRWRVEQAHSHRHMASRRTAVCYDKTLAAFSAFVILACCWRLLSKLVKKISG